MVKKRKKNYKRKESNSSQLKPRSVKPQKTSSVPSSLPFKDKIGALLKTFGASSISFKERRSLLISAGATGLATLAGGALLLTGDTSEEQEPLQVLPNSDIKTKWRDVFEMQVDDAELKKHVEGFLNLFEKGVFEFKLQHPQTKEITTHFITGQQVLADIAKINDEYERTGFRWKKGVSHLMRRGKIVIASHNRNFSSIKSGSNTMFADIAGGNPSGESNPVRINLGTQYLKGARYYGPEGSGLMGFGRASFPVTIANVLANEIAHVWYRSKDDVISNGFENIVTIPMGAESRGVDLEQIKFSRGGNGGYITLHDKVKTFVQPLSVNQRQNLSQPHTLKLKP